MRPLRKKIVIVVGIVAVVGVAAAAAAYLARYELYRMDQRLPAYTHESGAVLRERVEMRDGIHLATRVHLPGGDGPWPAVLVRNPYPMNDTIDFVCQVYARYGFACVGQDVRGRNESEGDWEPLVNEPHDGEDTLRWMVAQPWLDGNIALYGPSYLAAVQWAVADVLPPEVKTILPSIYTTDMHAAAYEGGMFRHEVLTAWAAGMPPSDDRHADGYLEAIRHRPHAEVDTLFFGGDLLPWYQDWIGNAAADAPLWQRPEIVRFRTAPERSTVPVLAIGGWFDVFLPGQLDDFERLATRARSKLVIGPWTHGLRAMGDIDYPGDEPGTTWRLTLDWLRHHLRGEPLEQTPNGIDTYALREGKWRHWDTWPPETEPVRLFLADAAQSAACDGGRLLASPPQSPETTSYVYDPDDPVPTRGGSAMLAYLIRGFVGQLPGSRDQEGLCDRADVLSFVSDPLLEPLHVAGPITVQLTVSSDAPDTAFTVKLIELMPDGRAVNIRDTITALSFRNGAGSPQPYMPGDVIPLQLELWPTEWQLAAGARLRLDVSSSNFPVYHAHTNRAGAWAEQADAVAAVQTLYTGGEHAAWVELPTWSAPGSPGDE